MKNKTAQEIYEKAREKAGSGYSPIGIVIALSDLKEICLSQEPEAAKQEPPVQDKGIEELLICFDLIDGQPHEDLSIKGVDTHWNPVDLGYVIRTAYKAGALSERKVQEVPASQLIEEGERFCDSPIESLGKRGYLTAEALLIHQKGYLLKSQATRGEKE